MDNSQDRDRIGRADRTISPRRRKRLFVPGALTISMFGGVACMAVYSGPLEGSCGDNKPECELYCLPSFTDAGVGDAAGSGVCPRCANDEGECPAGCEAVPPFT